jgi:hypothetical protein
MQENFARQEHERRRQLSKKRATGRFGEAGFSRFPRKRRQAQKSTEDTSGYHIFSKVQHPAQHVRVSGLIVAAARRRPRSGESVRFGTRASRHDSVERRFVVAGGEPYENNEAPGRVC